MTYVYGAGLRECYGMISNVKYITLRKRACRYAIEVRLQLLRAVKRFGLTVAEGVDGGDNNREPQ